jgi:glutathione S-transferase
MITLFDYLPSQNAWKVRQLFALLGTVYKTEFVSIFEGNGQSPSYLEVNPWGAVPAIRLEDGRVLSESNAILWYLSEGTVFRPGDAFAQAKIMQWLSFEADYIQTSVGGLRYWTLTGKLKDRPDILVKGKLSNAERAIRILDNEFSKRPFIVGDQFTIADISLFAYSHLASDAGVSIRGFPFFTAWISRVRAQKGFLADIYPYSIDPHSNLELP